MAVVTRRLFCRHLFLPQFRQTFRATKTRECQLRIQQLLNVLSVDCRALALPIGTIASPDIRPLIPTQAKPTQRTKNILLRFYGAALLIGILNSQQETAAMLMGETAIE
jgi:hypothetical protein